MRMLGRNTITPPTPPIIPSTRRSFNGPSGMKLRTKFPICSTPHSIHCMGYSPSLNVASNMNHMKKINMGNPSTLWVTKRSIICVLLTSFILFATNVSRSAPEIKPYRALVRAVSVSSFNISSSCWEYWLQVSRMGFVSGNDCTYCFTSLSFSSNLMAR